MTLRHSTLTMLICRVISVLVRSSHQTQGGKSGVNPALSRNCNESVLFSESGCPPIVVDVHQYLRGTDCV